MLCNPPHLPEATAQHPSMLDPWQMAQHWGVGTVMAVLTAIHGPAYRDPGAAMAIAADGRFAGAITAGCVEADIILRAEQVRQTGTVQCLRYGDGSPFFDLRLPCGGAVEVRLFLLRDPEVLDALADARTQRRAVSLQINGDGRMSLQAWHPTGLNDTTFHCGFTPALRFLIFGNGPESAAFSSLVHGLGYDHLLLSHVQSILAVARASGSPTQEIGTLATLDDLSCDAQTAVVLFYHDHDYEPLILQRMVHTGAFYIGAQGSRSTQARRLERLAALGLDKSELVRIRGPIGLTQSSRDPRSLAISVLAEIVDLYARTETARLLETAR